MKNHAIIPASLRETLEQHFSGKSFTFFSVMVHAKFHEIDDWKAALKTMAETGEMECVARRTLGDVFRMVTHPDVSLETYHTFRNANGSYMYLFGCHLPLFKSFEDACAYANKYGVPFHDITTIVMGGVA